MNFRAELAIEPIEPLWDHRTRFVSLGSCFADEMGLRLQRLLFQCLLNPFGTLFNPCALGRLLRRAAEDRPFEVQEFFEQDDAWRHFDIHGKLACATAAESCALANTRLAALSDALAKSDTLLLTLGTAWIYRHVETGADVGHNHRLPLRQFEKQLLTIDSIADALRQAIGAVRRINPGLRIVVTISPVRHLRDGLHANNLSKSVLHLAAEALRSDLPGVDYFPAYELVTDDLRDYRFFKEDFAHPTDQAVGYVWEKLAKAWLSDEAQELCREIESLRRSLDHTPRAPRSQAHKAFLDQLEQRLNALTDRKIDIAPLKARYDDYANV